MAVVVPAYNEAARIGPTLQRLREYLSSQARSWRVLVVSDGSTDDTVAIARSVADSDERFAVHAYDPNRGKGYAVRLGMLEAEADWVLFSDADLATPIEEIEKLFEAADRGADVAIGSRPLRESRLEVRQPWYREWAGRLFNKLVQVLAVPGIRDTQCGFKLFRQEAARDVFSRCKLDGFGFDFEALLVARDLGYRIAEVGVRWRHQEGSKVNMLRDGPRMLRDLVKLRLMGRRRRLEKRANRGISAPI